MQIYEWKSGLFYEDISPTAKLVGMAISEFYRDGKECYPSLPTILDVTGHTSINTIRKAIEELKDAELIQVKEKRIKGRGGKPVNSYIFSGVNDQLSNNDSSSDISNDSSVDSSYELANNDSEVTNTLEVTKVTNKKDTNVSTKKENKPSVDEINFAFSIFWENYGNKKGRGHALKAFKKLTPQDMQKVLDVVQSPEFQENQKSLIKKTGDFRKHPSTWLNAEGWKDEYSTFSKKSPITNFQDNEEPF